MRSQLSEDIFGQARVGLTGSRKRAIQEIERPQLQEDVYLSVVGSYRSPKSREPYQGAD